MPTPKIRPEKLIYIYLQSMEEKLIMQQKGIPVPYMSRIWLLDMAMDAIGYPPHQYDCDSFYYELYMVQPPGHSWFVNAAFSRLYWYQVANSATTAEWEEIYDILCRDIRILREKLPYYFTTTQRRRTY